MPSVYLHHRHDVIRFSSWGLGFIRTCTTDSLRFGVYCRPQTKFATVRFFTGVSVHGRGRAWRDGVCVVGGMHGKGDVW